VLQAGLELLGAVAAATEAGPQWPPVSAAFAAVVGAAAAGVHGQHSMPIASARGVRAAAAGVAVAAAAAAAGGPEADDDASQEVSYGSQRSRGARASGSASAGSTGLALVCQVRAAVSFQKVVVYKKTQFACSRLCFCRGCS
jgi:hypothetical protein